MSDFDSRARKAAEAVRRQIAEGTWICGDPGSESMVKVKAPRAIVPGISRFGIPLWRNISAANGYPPLISFGSLVTMPKLRLLVMSSCV